MTLLLGPFYKLFSRGSEALFSSDPAGPRFSSFPPESRFPSRPVGVVQSLSFTSWLRLKTSLYISLLSAFVCVLFTRSHRGQVKVIKTDVNVVMSEGRPRVCGRSEGGHAVTEEDAGTEDVTRGGSSSERKASLCITFRNAVFVSGFLYSQLV